MQMPVFEHQAQGFIEQDRTVQAKPLAGMPVPHDVKAEIVAAFLIMIEVRPSTIEFFALIGLPTGAVTRDEAVFAPAPFPRKINRIVALRRPDFGEKAWFEDIADKGVTNSADTQFVLGFQRSHAHPTGGLPFHELGFRICFAPFRRGIDLDMNIMWCVYMLQETRYGKCCNQESQRFPLSGIAKLCG
jgi:hypothetical protein